MQDKTAIRSNDNLDCVKHARLLGEKYTLCCVVSIVCIVLINKEKKLFTDASWKTYVELTVHCTMI
jgi:hypothetical protein